MPRRVPRYAPDVLRSARLTPPLSLALLAPLACGQGPGVSSATGSTGSTGGSSGPQGSTTASPATTDAATSGGSGAASAGSTAASPTTDVLSGSSTTAAGHTTSAGTTGDSGTTGGPDASTGDPSASSTGDPGCPDNGPPPGPALRRFDVATLNCPAEPCPAEQDQCLCPLDFAGLNVGPAHFMATGTDNNKELVWGAGNFQAMYVDDLNTDWQAGGAARADALIASAAAKFPCGAPEWFIVNEISAGQWPDNADYRQFVVDFATAMKDVHGKTVVIAAPFAKPGKNAASWQALAKKAFIGAEIYLSGKEINASGNSVAWCKSQYQAGVDAYAALGVPAERLFLVEHFGQTTADKSWGRAGVSVAGWHNAIKARAEAAAQLGLPGFVSYAWSWNLMHAGDADRLDFMATYAAQDLP